jgi:hypothetical protein
VLTCCKVLSIDALDKPQDKWCKHCRPGKGGCSIYAGRPPICRGFACQWLVDPDFGDEWWPLDCRMVAHYKPDSLGRIGLNIVVEASSPAAWRYEPYFSQIKAMALHFLRTESKIAVYVHVGKRQWVVLPNKEVEITDVPAHVIMPVGPDRWKVICFDSVEKGKEFIRKVDELDAQVDALSEGDKRQLLAEIRARFGGV